MKRMRAGNQTCFTLRGKFKNKIRKKALSVLKSSELLN
jgi:hypothetical protein